MGMPKLLACCEHHIACNPSDWLEGSAVAKEVEQASSRLQCASHSSWPPEGLPLLSYQTTNAIRGDRCECKCCDGRREHRQWHSNQYCKCNLEMAIGWGTLSQHGSGRPQKACTSSSRVSEDGRQQLKAGGSRSGRKKQMQPYHLVKTMGLQPSDCTG